MVLGAQVVIHAAHRLAEGRVGAEAEESRGELEFERAPEGRELAGFRMRREPGPPRLPDLSLELRRLGDPREADHAGRATLGGFSVATIQRGQNGSCPGSSRTSSAWIASRVARSRGRAARSPRIHASAASIARSASRERAWSRPKDSETSQLTASPCFAQG